MSSRCRRTRVLGGAAILGGIVVAARTGLLGRTGRGLLIRFSDSAWSIPGLPAAMARLWKKRVAQFAAYDVQPGDVIMLGDSLTEGTDWQHLLPGIRIHNFGIGGDDTVGVLRRLDQVTDRQPGKIFLLIGSNDIGKGRDVDEIADNVSEILGRLGDASPGATLYLQSVLPRWVRRAPEVHALNARLEAIARDRSVTWIDLHPSFDRGDGGMELSFSPDSLHLNAAGYRRWLEQLEPFVADSPAPTS